MLKMGYLSHELTVPSICDLQNATEKKPLLLSLRNSSLAYLVFMNESL